MKRITFVDLTPQFIEKQYRGVARLLREGRKASREREYRDWGGSEWRKRRGRRAERGLGIEEGEGDEGVEEGAYASQAKGTLQYFSLLSTSIRQLELGLGLLLLLFVSRGSGSVGSGGSSGGR